MHRAAQISTGMNKKSSAAGPSQEPWKDSWAGPACRVHFSLVAYAVAYTFRDGQSVPDDVRLALQTCLSCFRLGRWVHTGGLQQHPLAQLSMKLARQMNGAVEWDARVCRRSVAEGITPERDKGAA